MIDDDHDRDPADYDNKKVVADGDGNVLSISRSHDIMSCGAWRQALQRLPQARRQGLKAGDLNRNEINTWDFVVNFWSTFDHIQNGLPAVLHFGKSRRSVF